MLSKSINEDQNLHGVYDDEQDEVSRQKYFILKRINIEYEDEECQLVIFSDITENFNQQLYLKNKIQNEFFHLLKECVFNQIMIPIQQSLEVGKSLISRAELQGTFRKDLLKLTISLNLASFFANDLIDEKSIEQKKF